MRWTARLAVVGLLSIVGSFEAIHSAWAGYPPVGKIKFDSRLPDELYQRLSESLQFLSQIPTETKETPEGKKLKALMELSTLSASTITEWLEERVKYIGPEIELLSDRRRVRLIELMFYDEVHLGTPDSSAYRYNIQMTNVGSAMYESAKRSELLYGYQFLDQDQLTLLPILSSRVGIIEVSPNLVSDEYLFGPNNYRTLSAGKKPSEIQFSQTAKKLMMLSILVHEAVHGDGNSEAGTLGFGHESCPKGHPGNHSGCDKFSNGPYPTGAQFLLWASQAFKLDSLVDQKIVELDFLSSMSRVVQGATPGDKTPEYIEAPAKLKKLLNNTP
jgi:hypothetical protein